MSVIIGRMGIVELRVGSELVLLKLLLLLLKLLKLKLEKGIELFGINVRECTCGGRWLL